MVAHPLSPIFDSSSHTLILGSFPSVRSREVGFYYGHPKNRFFRVIAALYQKELPKTDEEKRSLLLSSGLALWDVIASCEITGSADSSIKNVRVNDMASLLGQAPIKRIFLNGKTAAKYYEKYLKGSLGIEATVLPSTSPANAAYSFDKLLDAWRAIVR